MKKLMIAAAIVCAAAFVQAASIDWSVTASSWSLQNGNKAGKNYTGVYLIDSAKLDTIIAAIGTDGSLSLSTEGVLAQGTTGTSTKGAVASSTATKDPYLVRGQPYDFAVLLIDTVSDKGPYYAVSGEYNQKTYLSGTDEATSVSFGTDKFGANAQSYAGGTMWQAVPEPTSGLLLLLGVAGLALRRRRA